MKQMRLDKLSIPAFDAVISADTLDFYALPGFPKGSDYALEPQNSFQKWMRLAMEKEDKVTAHYTSRFSGQIVEGQVISVLFYYNWSGAQQAFYNSGLLQFLLILKQITMVCPFINCIQLSQKCYLFYLQQISLISYCHHLHKSLHSNTVRVLC